MKEPLAFKEGDEVLYDGRRYRIEKIHEFGPDADPQTQLRGIGHDIVMVVGARLKDCTPIPSRKKK
jgi:hypothetical protein